MHRERTSKTSAMILLFVLLLSLFAPQAAPAQAAPAAFPGGRVYVNDDAPGPTHDGLSWATAFTGLQAGIDAASSGDEVWVAAGTYKPTTGADRSISFVMKQGVRIYGGFSATETARSQRKWRTNTTILSGDIGAAGNAADNSYHVLNNSANNLTSAAVLDGFTISGGNANGTNPSDRGGGMINLSSSPALANLRFANNSATGDGGGVYDSGSGSYIVNVGFTDNTSTAKGGGMYSAGSVSLINVVFNGNRAYQGGGWYTNSSVTVTNATFTRNDATDPGAANGQGGGLYNNQANLTLRNTIIWGNTAENGSETVHFGSGQIVYYHCDTPSMLPGNGNINTNPQFVNAPLGDVHLQSTSPAKDAGNNAYLPLDPLDLDGDGNLAEQIPLDRIGGVRITGPAVDMGAFERQPVFVNDNAPGPTFDGQSWATAYTGLQNGIDAAASGDEVWVATGVYQPTYGSDRSISFNLKEGVRVYGGFTATETALSQRSLPADATVLSGDLGTVGTLADNSQHVVNGGDGLTSATVLDGFMISWGNASFTEGGGGIYISSGSPTLSNLLITGNFTSQSGGGLYLGTGSPTLTNVTFNLNQSGSHDGGGMATMGGSPTLSNVTFEQNYAGDQGGALYAAGTPALINVTFKDNWAVEGGGIFALADMALTNAVFCGNQSDHGGGAVYTQSSSPTLINTTFSGNSSGSGYSGGAIYNHNGNPLLRNSVVWGNPSLNNLSIYDENSMYRVSASYSDIQNQSLPGIENINADPRFRYPPTCDLRLQGESPAMNEGFTAYLGADITDLDGDGNTAEQIPVDRNGGRRVVNASVDMGALERQPIYVNAARPSGNYSGDSWSTAMKQLYDGINSAEAGDEIWVASGTYMPNASSGTMFAWFKLVDGVAIYGGFNGTETSASQRNWNTNVTVLSCNLGLPDQDNDNCLHVINTQTAVLTTATVLDGFTITGGFGEISGGGMYLGENSSPTLRNLIFTDNDVTGFGGGLYTIGPQVSLTNVIFLGNYSGFGGAIYNGTGGLTLTNGSLIDNHAGSMGGGIYNNGNFQATNVVISGSSAGHGGGIFIDTNSSAILTNVTIGGNTATWGGGIYNFQGDVLIRNSILWGNTAPNSPQIGNFEIGGTVTVSNSDVQGGYAGTGNIASDPLFVSLATDILRLRPISPAINRGNNGVTLPSLPATDVTGSPRIADTIVDMGAYEHATPNHSPAVSGAFSLPTISEDPASVAGSAVSSFLTGAGVSDAESNPVGMAVVGADSTGGAWQYSLNGGVNWNSLPAVSDSSALLLARTAWLRFTPNLNWNGAATLTFRGWDGTDGSASGASGVNVTVNGFATPFSGQTATLSAPVTPVNDAPTLEHAIPDQVASEDNDFTFTFAADTFVDVDVSDSLMYSAEAIDGAGNPAAWPGWLSFNGVTRAFSGTPDAADIGAIHIRLTATDSASESATDEFDIIVSHTNHPPYPNTGVTVADQIVLSGLPFALVVPDNAFLDADTGDTLAWSATLENDAALPAWLHFDPASRTFSGAPAFADTGLLTVRVIVHDSGGATATLTFKIQVNGRLFLPIISKQP